MLVPPGSAEHLATAIASLLADASARAELAQAGSQHASGHTYPAMVAAVAEMYSSLLPQQGGHTTATPGPRKFPERSAPLAAVESDKLPESTG